MFKVVFLHGASPETFQKITEDLLSASGAHHFGYSFAYVKLVDEEGRPFVLDNAATRRYVDRNDGMSAISFGSDATPQTFFDVLKIFDGGKARLLSGREVVLHPVYLNVHYGLEDEYNKPLICCDVLGRALIGTEIDDADLLNNNSFDRLGGFLENFGYSFMSYSEQRFRKTLYRACWALMEGEQRNDRFRYRIVPLPDGSVSFERTMKADKKKKYEKFSGLDADALTDKLRDIISDEISGLQKKLDASPAPSVRKKLDERIGVASRILAKL